MKKIVISGGNGRLCKELVKANKERFMMFTPNRVTMDITDHSSLEKALDLMEPDVFIHAAALAKPLALHDSDICKSIDTNIIGTANVVKACSRRNIKLVYISTDYVYPKESMNAGEADPVLPFTNYGWSKLGGECAVAMYPNSLILRGAFFETPFPYDAAYTNVYKNQMYQDQAAEIILQLLDQTGVVNIGAKAPKSIFDFAKATKPDVHPILYEGTSASLYMILDVTRMGYTLNSKEKM